MFVVSAKQAGSGPPLPRDTPAKVLVRPWLIAVLASVAVLLVSLACGRTTLRHPSGVSLRDGSGAARLVDLPYSGEATLTRPLEFEMHLQGGPFTPEWFVIVPDDHLVSIAVNGRALSLEGIDPARLDDYRAGFSYPLGRELSAGGNRVEVVVLNKGGKGGLDVRADPSRGAAAAELATATLALLVLIGASMRGARCRWSSVALAEVAVLVRVAYLWVTPYTTRGHDADEHLAYVQYLFGHHALPKASEGYAFYHPPLYYLASALVRGTLAAAGFGAHEIVVALQLQSMLFNLGFVAFAAATARLWIDRIPVAELGRRLWSARALALLCGALIALWPSCIMHAARIGNDDLTYLCFGGALYFGSRWWLAGREARPACFYLAAGWGALGMISKTNSLIIFAVLGTLLVARLIENRERRLRVILAYVAPLAALFAIATGIALHEAIGATLSGKQDVLLVANAHQNSPKLLVGNRAANYLWLDLRTFVTVPFTSAWDDDKGRQYFWNYLLKTSLFGEWTFPQSAASDLGTILSILCLIMFLLVFAGLWLRSARELYGELPLWTLAVFLVGSLALIRMKIPNSCTGDFRYILPVLLPLAFAYVRTLAVFRRRGWMRLAWGGLAAGWLLPVLSLAFIAIVVLSE
jgi:hypothetical protein